MTVDLADYLEENWDPNHDPRFGLSWVSERDGVRTDLVAVLSELVATHKADPEVLRDLIEAAGWSTAVAPLLPGRTAVRRGDLGEVITAEAVESFDDRVVPIRKLRYQIDPNQTLPGADVVAFEWNDDGSIQEIVFMESKFRVRPELRHPGRGPRSVGGRQRTAVRDHREFSRPPPEGA